MYVKVVNESFFSLQNGWGINAISVTSSRIGKMLSLESSVRLFKLSSKCFKYDCETLDAMCHFQTFLDLFQEF